jgi:hypothetical protein
MARAHKPKATAHAQWEKTNKEAFFEAIKIMVIGFDNALTSLEMLPCRERRAARAALTYAGMLISAEVSEDKDALKRLEDVEWPAALVKLYKPKGDHAQR